MLGGQSIAVRRLRARLLEGGEPASRCFEWANAARALDAPTLVAVRAAVASARHYAVTQEPRPATHRL